MTFFYLTNPILQIFSFLLKVYPQYIIRENRLQYVSFKSTLFPVYV